MNIPRWVKCSRRYQIATAILTRCNNVNNKRYKNYGGRGIKCLLGTTIKEVYLELLKVPHYYEAHSMALQYRAHLKATYGV